jgi:putative membrane protein
MIAERSTRVRTLVRDNFFRILAVVVITGSVEWANNYVDLDRPALSVAAVTLLVTALSIFLVFRVNEAYQRWWEARTLWGAIVNDSRSFARQVLSLLRPIPGDQESERSVRALQREMVLRQIAWINALRLGLRRQDELDPLVPFLPAGEAETLSEIADRPSQLMLTQAKLLAEARAAGQVGEMAQHRIETTMTSLQNAQGGCERIKKTPFPDRVVYFTRFCAWSLAIVIPVALMAKSDGFDPIDYVVLPFMMLAFLVTERLGAELKNPFENQPNDTPMTAICRTIEIGLLQQLGEDDVPPPLEPENGVLM